MFHVDKQSALSSASWDGVTAWGQHRAGLRTHSLLCSPWNSVWVIPGSGTCTSHIYWTNIFTSRWGVQFCLSSYAQNSNHLTGSSILMAPWDEFKKNTLQMPHQYPRWRIVMGLHVRAVRPASVGGLPGSSRHPLLSLHVCVYLQNVCCSGSEGITHNRKEKLVIAH